MPLVSGYRLHCISLYGHVTVNLGLHSLTVRLLFLFVFANELVLLSVSLLDFHVPFFRLDMYFCNLEDIVKSC